MIHGMSGGPGPVLHGVVELDGNALNKRPLPNPTRSLLLGDPASGALVYGCLIDLDEDGELRGGISAPARLLFWQRLHPALPGPVPIRYRRVIGHIRDLWLVTDS